MPLNNFKAKIYPLEYTFKSPTLKKLQTVILSDYSMTVRSNGSERTIPYANITNVRLCRVSPTFYKTIIQHDSDKSMVITNQYLVDPTTSEDRSHMYSTFIRVLHYHLKDKSAASYTSGCSKETLWNWGIFSVMLSFTFSFTASYLGFSLMNPYIMTMILTCVIAVVIFLLYAGRLPKEYLASDIPLKLLP